MYHVSFQPKVTLKVSWSGLLDKILEYFFWLDLCLNFIHSFINAETQEVVVDIKEIAKNYVFKGWFVIDFVSVFPFEQLFPTGSLTKLLRLFRLPRLIKLIDIDKFQKMLQSLMDSQSKDEQIVA